MLSNYSELQDSIAEWLDRADLEDRIPDFIALAESKIKRRVRRKTVRATIGLNQQAVSLPTDCAEARSLRLITSQTRRDTPIEVGTPEILAQHRAQLSVTGRPRFAAVIDGSLVLAPTPDQLYTAEITYFQKLTPLSASVTVNNILTEAPDVYLYGSLVEASAFLENDERIPLWKGGFDAGIEELNTAREREEYTASLRPQRLPVVFG